MFELVDTTLDIVEPPLTADELRLREHEREPLHRRPTRHRTRRRRRLARAARNASRRRVSVTSEPSAIPLRTAASSSASLSHIASTRSSAAVLLRPRQVCTEVRPPAGPRLLVLARALLARAKREVEDLDGLPCFELTPRTPKTWWPPPSATTTSGLPRTATFATGRNGVAGSLIGAAAERRTTIRSAKGASSSRSGTKFCCRPRTLPYPAGTRPNASRNDPPRGHQNSSASPRSTQSAP